MIHKKNFGEEHADVATGYFILAAVYENTGEYREAKELYEKALMIQKKILGEEHHDVVRTSNNLSAVNDRIAESRTSNGNN